MKEAFGTISPGELAKRGIGSEEFIDTLLAQLEKMPKVAGGTANTMENLGDSVAALYVSVGDAIKKEILPIIDKIAIQVKKMKDRWVELAPEVQRIIVLIGGALVTIGPALAILGVTMLAVGAGITVIGGALSYLLSPMGLVVASSVAIVATFTDWKAVGVIIQSLAKKAMGFVKSWTHNLNAFKEWIMPWIRTIQGDFQNIGNVITEFITDKLGWIGETQWADNGVSAVRRFVGGALGFFMNLRENVAIIWNWLQDNWVNILIEIAAFFGRVMQMTANNQVVVLKTLGRLWVAFGGYLLSLIKKIFETDFQKVVWNGLSKAFDMIKNWAKLAAKSVKDALLGKTNEDLLDQLVDDIDDGASELNFFKTAGKIIAEQAKDLQFASFEGVTGLEGPKLNLEVEMPDFKFEGPGEKNQWTKGIRSSLSKGLALTKGWTQNMVGMFGDVKTAATEMLAPLHNDAIHEGTKEYRDLVADSVRLLNQQPLKSNTKVTDNMNFIPPGAGQLNLGQTEKKSVDLLDVIRGGIMQLVKIEEVRDNTDEGEGLGLGGV